MITIAQVEREAEAQADNMTVEIILLLIDKWERELASQELKGSEAVNALLNHYVKLKISLHHLNKAWWNEFRNAPKTEEDYTSQYKTLLTKTKDARRNYYVARRKYRQQEHGAECACRGCRCIKGIEPGRKV